MGVKLVLDIDGTEPLTGRIARPDGLTRSFRGWVGLAAAVDDELLAAAEPAPQVATSVEDEA